jgi:putative ABC transport system ATP-binding protein
MTFLALRGIVKEYQLGKTVVPALQRPDELSGGQRQRVAIARALITEPELVLADEPTANLDSVTSEQIIDLMQQLNREKGVTFLFSTHDPRIMQHANRVVRIADGRIVEEPAVAA